ncbi:autotransporter outer membrane beta-barrel domain-containing protein [Bradyrhizobium sp. ORS 86]|uniref:autotransporter family protein n=1 Tax=Bradyrhizobium sp. ORS 86 TaxID=1685970 RepID=UPI00388DCAA1
MVSATAISAPGQYGTGGNTIEFGSNGTLTVDQGGQVLALGTQGSAEAVNFHGTDNTVVNSGTISAANGVAIWSQNVTGLNTVINTETGLIQAPVNAIGGSGNGALDFTNRGTVNGNLVLAGGNDTLRFTTGSVLNGDFNGGAGNDTIFLSGSGQDSLHGNMAGFETLIKEDPGTWTLTGTITGVTASIVQQGTLILTGNNSNYTGSILVDPAGTLQARAQSLPPTVTNNGLVRFAQTDDGTYTGLISGTGAVEKTGPGTLTLAPTSSGGNSYSGGTRLNEGVVAVGADNALGAATGGLTFNGGTLQFNSAFDLAASRPIALNAGGGTLDVQGFNSTITQGTTGTGALTKLGSGMLALNGDNAHSGGTNVAVGTLIVGDASHPGAALSGGGPVAVAADAMLGGYGSVTGTVTNNGTIATANALPGLADGPNGNFTINGELRNNGIANLAGSGVGNSLTVAGNYIGGNGQLHLNSVLAADGSPSDRLVISGGTATGTTAISVTNVGGAGAQTLADGIMVVQAVNGGTTAASAFSLSGGASAGAYEYFLFKGGVTAGTGDNWYLRSNVVAGPTPAPGSPPLPVVAAGADPIPLYRPEVALYSAVPSIARQMGLAMLGTFHERQGDQSLLVGGNGVVSAGWGRVFGQGTEQSWSGAVSPEFDGYVAGVQTGVDLFAREAASGHRDRAGLFFGYSRADGDVRGFAVGQRAAAVGDLMLDGYSLGGYWTHIGPSGWYVDAVLMNTWMVGDPRSIRSVGADTDGNVVTASLEGGYPIAIAPHLTLEPQAQAIWQHASLDATQDRFSTVAFNTTDSFTGRIGARLQGDVQTASGLLQPYLKANLWYGSGPTDNVTFASVDVIPTLGRATTSFEIGGGVAARLTQAVSLYGSAGYTTEIDGDRSRTIRGNLGLRVAW